MKEEEIYRENPKVDPGNCSAFLATCPELDVTEGTRAVRGSRSLAREGGGFSLVIVESVVVILEFVLEGLFRVSASPLSCHWRRA